MIWIRTGCLDSKKSTSSSVFHDGGRQDFVVKQSSYKHKWIATYTMEAESPPLISQLLCSDPDLSFEIAT